MQKYVGRIDLFQEKTVAHAQGNGKDYARISRKGYVVPLPMEGHELGRELSGKCSRLTTCRRRKDAELGRNGSAKGKR